MIGILYPRPMLSRLISGKRSFEKPSFYLETARKTGEEIVFFSLPDIDWKKGKVRCWDGVNPVLFKRPLPPVIINRTRLNRVYFKNAIQRLKQMGLVIFNEHNVISKLEIHNILSRNPKILSYLPATNAVTHHSVKDLLEQNSSLFLKPRTASIGNGIIRIRKINDDTFAETNVLGRTKRKKMDINQIVENIKKKKRSYLVQQGISLMTYKGKLVDFRVSMQKDGKGRWQYTGMVGKLAKRGSIVTNLHCGGKSVKVSKLFQKWDWNESEIERKIVEMGLCIAKTLDKELPHIADLGLDIALDEQQHPWFIEANFRDLRITFRNAGEKEKWRATFATPIYYASYLNKQLSEKKSNTSEEFSSSEGVFERKADSIVAANIAANIESE